MTTLKENISLIFSPVVIVVEKQSTIKMPNDSHRAVLIINRRFNPVVIDVGKPTTI